METCATIQRNEESQQFGNRPSRFRLQLQQFRQQLHTYVAQMLLGRTIGNLEWIKSRGFLQLGRELRDVLTKVRAGTPPDGFICQPSEKHGQQIRMHVTSQQIEEQLNLQHPIAAVRVGKTRQRAKGRSMRFDPIERFHRRPRETRHLQKKHGVQKRAERRVSIPHLENSVSPAP